MSPREAITWPRSVDRVLFCDVDETYLPADEARLAQSSLAALEDALESAAGTHGLLVGFVTGRELGSVLERLDRAGGRLPHFIASSLGTEFHWVRDGTVTPSGDWADSLAAAGYSRERAVRTVARLELAGVHLAPQDDAYQGPYKASYYYSDSRDAPASREEDFRIIRERVAEQGLGVTFARCAAAAGDPADWWDVEIVPLGTGKAEVTEFIRRRFQLPAEALWAVGDSDNDVEMLRAVANGWLVGNAEPRLKGAFVCTTTNRSYADGVVEVVERIVK